MNQGHERTEIILPGPAHAFAALLGVDPPDLDAGEGLPLLWHWLYLLERPAQADLGPDGHPVRGAVPAPPAPGLRRMWAGGQVRTLAPLRCGEAATRRSRTVSTVEKMGRSGRLVFVAVDHEIRQADQVVVQERQDIVYREPRGTTVAAEPDPAPSPLTEEDWSVEVTPTLLFRFSALTYNAHRIHYDRDYARTAEGYPGLLTHGPLQALAMAEAARTRGLVRDQHLTYEYRLDAPLFDHQGLVVRATRHGDDVLTSVRDLAGRQTAHGTIVPTPSA
ncbi:FAS1-like dehydratase domain-containing protein [Phytohabitans kaempferiae]|uniref:MaoC family dehydratase N-terminal domain-containing protein n=1 Tax=Phytohabitans kaempferiae TaxID=1620943 RepID=A0ABV6LZ00_9ACTN